VNGSPTPASSTESALPAAVPSPRPSRSQQAVDRFAALPRAGKWLVLAGALALAVYLVNNLAGVRADEMNERADRNEALLEAAVNRADALPTSVAERAIAFGPNSVPGRESASKEKFASAVASIMGKRGVSTYGFDVRSNSLSGDVLPKVASELNGVMARTIAEVKFEATAETANQIISDLDRSPEIDAISDVRLTYSSKTRRVSAAITLERWGVVPRGGAS
jgi:hypothetical protein